MEPTDQERDLLEGFIARRPEAERAFVEALRPQVWKWIHAHFADLVFDGREIEGRAFDLLVHWRADPKKLGATEPLWKLARRLVDQVGDVERARIKRDKATARTSRALDKLGEPAPSPEASCVVTDLASKLSALISQLPDEFRETFRAMALEATGQGPPLTEFFGISSDAARMRLVRARHQLLDLAIRAKLLSPDDVTALTHPKEVTRG